MQYDRATGVIPMNSKSSVQAEERKYTLTSVEKTHRKDFSHVFPKPSVLRKGCAGLSQRYKPNCSLHLVFHSYRYSLSLHQEDQLEQLTRTR